MFMSKIIKKQEKTNVYWKQVNEWGVVQYVMMAWHAQQCKLLTIVGGVCVCVCVQQSCHAQKLGCI